MKRTIASAGVDEYDTTGESIISTSNESTTYTYDQAGQLKTSYNSRTGIKYYYTYDANGNIVCREEYSVASDNTETLLEKITYVYSGTVLMLSQSSVDGYVRYTNDNMGNPIKIQKDGTTYTLTWGEGRMLKGISKDNNNNVTYNYNVDGLRTKKVVKENGVSTVTEYVWGNNGPAGMQTELGTVIVFYDVEGQPVGFSLNNEVYHYVKNLQGDIVRILDENGNTVVEYSYDPWGVPTVTGDAELAKINPCSYRGYDYDEETGYYYLQSRYYDPEIGRFISSDEALILQLTTTELLPNNLYSYCNNNSVNDADVSGYLSMKDVVALVKSVFKKIVDGLAKYIKNLFVIDIKEKTVSIHTDIVSIAVNTLISYKITSYVYGAATAALKQLLKNQTIRKEFVKTMFKFFVENSVGQFVLKRIVIIGLGLIGIKSTAKSLINGIVSGFFGNIITNKWAILAAPVRLISNFSSFGGIAAFFVDWMDGKWNDNLTIKVSYG